MVIDTMDIRNALVSRAVHVGDKVSSIIHSDNFIGELGGALIALGVILGIGQLVHQWIKRKGYRMVLKDRNDKMHALLLRINQDGIDDAVEKGEISNQEANKLFNTLATRLGLRDLVPKKRMARQVKAEIKARLVTGSKARAKIPGDPPTPIKSVKTTAKASPFWKKSA